MRDSFTHDYVDIFDPRFPNRGVCLPLEQMNLEQLEFFRECYYLGLIAPTVFGTDADGTPTAPHGWSIHGAPKLRPEDQ
jgi:hypothetical protein